MIPGLSEPPLFAEYRKSKLFNLQKDGHEKPVVFARMPAIAVYFKTLMHLVTYEVWEQHNSL